MNIRSRLHRRSDVGTTREALAGDTPTLAVRHSALRHIADLRIAVLLVVLLLSWKAASELIGGYKVPSISNVANQLRDTVTSAEGLQNLGITVRAEETATA